MLDIDDMYPSVKLSMINKTIRYFRKKLNKIENQKIETGLEFLTFGMCNILIIFNGKYYKHGRKEDKENKGLAIRGY